MEPARQPHVRNLKNLLAFHGPHSNAVVWAHNSHVGNAAATEMALRGEYNIGQLCRKEFGEPGLEANKSELAYLLRVHRGQPEMMSCFDPSWPRGAASSRSGPGWHAVSPQSVTELANSGYCCPPPARCR